MQHRFFNPLISVVVLTRNRRAEAVRTVTALLRLPERPEVIVVDNGSTDGTPQLLAHVCPGLRVLRCGTNLGAAGRNVGAAQVGTRYVAFSDDDTEWQPGALADAVELLERHPRIGTLCARVVVGAARTLDPTCERMAASPLAAADHPLRRLTGFMAGAAVFRTAVFRELGGYEPQLFIGGEEALLSLDVLQAGYDIAYAPSLEVHHRPSPVRDSALRRRVLARNAALVAWLRLPRREAMAATWRALASACKEARPSDDLCALVRGIRWAARRRRPVAARVLRLREAVCDAERRHAARRPSLLSLLSLASRPSLSSRSSASSCDLEQN
ncbi:glycosyltransferase family 2 protein [Paraburkholderia sp. A1RI-2L]|uniref:glycosyltransferase family 2 protein n=1 Tax=Paraburkholderia sp. A1RI-2L TaxID=3028367 RepID=UPI003B81B989